MLPLLPLQQHVALFGTVQIHAQPDKHKVVRHCVRLWGWQFNNISW